jgi:hypothetical protein
LTSSTIVATMVKLQGGNVNKLNARRFLDKIDQLIKDTDDPHQKEFYDHLTVLVSDFVALSEKVTHLESELARQIKIGLRIKAPLIRR